MSTVSIPLENISEGQIFQKEFHLNQTVYDHFLEAFSDNNPLHTNDAYAQSKGFSARVMHGAILNGFISHFVGMTLPLKNTVLHSVQIEFKKPNYLNDRILLEAKVGQKVEAVKTIVLEIKINNLTRDYLSAKAKVQVGVLK